MTQALDTNSLARNSRSLALLRDDRVLNFGATFEKSPSPTSSRVRGGWDSSCARLQPPQLLTPQPFEHRYRSRSTSAPHSSKAHCPRHPEFAEGGIHPARGFSLATADSSTVRASIQSRSLALLRDDHFRKAHRPRRPRAARGICCLFLSCVPSPRRAGFIPYQAAVPSAPRTPAQLGSRKIAALQICNIDGAAFKP